MVVVQATTIIEDWRITEVVTATGFVVLALLDDGVEVLADIDVVAPDPS